MHAPSHHPAISSPPRNALSDRAFKETESDSPLCLPVPEELEERNQAPLCPIDPPPKRSVIRPCAPQVNCTSSDQPSVKTSTYSPPSLNHPSVSASPSSSHTAQPSTNTSSSWIDTPRGLLPDQPQALWVGAPSELPHPPQVSKNISPHTQRHDHRISDPGICGCLCRSICRLRHLQRGSCAEPTQAIGKLPTYTFSEVQ
jgi:hypothetical protein